MAAADDSGPQPTAHEHEVVPGCSLDRRTFVKSSAALAAIAAGGAASSGTAAAASDLMYYPTTPSVTGMVAAKAVGDWSSKTNTDVTADKTIMHQTATSEHETFKSHQAIINNYLEDTPTLASLEARHAIATAWENGESSTVAYDNALSAIRDYYAVKEINHFEMLSKLLVQISHISNTAWNDDNIGDGFLSTYVANNSDGGTQQLNTISPNRVDVTFTLQNGNEHTVKMPEWYFETDLNTYQAALTQSHLDNYDTSNELFTFTDGSGNTWDTPLNIIVQNVGSDLESQSVFDMREWYDYWQDIRDQSDTVTANYSQTFVDDLYAAMDDGTLDPSKVRGPEAQARFLSGTDDVTADRFKMALLHQLEMSQADLSKVASMTVSYDGYTSLEANRTDSGTRSLYPTDYVADKTYEGLLFADSIPSAGLDTGETYAVGPTLYSANETSASGDPVFYALDALTRSKRWTYDGLTGDASSVVADDHGEFIAVGDINGTVHCLNADDGTQKWVWGQSTIVSGLAQSPDGSVIYALVRDDGLYALNADDGSVKWSVALSNQYSLAIGPNGTVYTGDGDGTLTARDSTDGSQKWTFGMTNTYARAIVVSADGSRVYVAGNGGLIECLDGSGSKQWDVSVSSSAVFHLELSPDESQLFASDADGLLTAVNTSDQSTAWTDSSFAVETPLRMSPGGRNLYAGGDGAALRTYNPADGSVVSTDTYSSGAFVDLDITGNLPGVAGMVSDGLFYDGPSGSEVQMTNGLLTLEQMTDRDGNTVEHTGDEWNTPKYNTYDATEFAEYTETVETYQEQLEAEDSGGDSSDDPLFGGLFSGGGGGGLVGLAIVGGVLALVFGWVTDLIPGVGN